MADNDFPIDINYAKIADWIVRFCFSASGKVGEGRSSWTLFFPPHRHCHDRHHH